MSDELRERLKDKGWENRYIEKTIEIVNNADEKRLDITKKIDKIIYFIAILIAIVGNFIISIILIPFLITITNKIALGVIIFAISLSFGYLFNFILKDIKELDTQNHIIAGLFIPCLGVINIFVITNVSNHFVNILNIQNPHNPIVVGFIYLASFITPYFSDKLFNKPYKSKKNERD